MVKRAVLKHGIACRARASHHYTISNNSRRRHVSLLPLLVTARSRAAWEWSYKGRDTCTTMQKAAANEIGLNTTGHSDPHRRRGPPNYSNWALSGMRCHPRWSTTAPAILAFAPWPTKHLTNSVPDELTPLTSPDYSDFDLAKSIACPNDSWFFSEASRARTRKML